MAKDLDVEVVYEDGSFLKEMENLRNAFENLGLAITEAFLPPMTRLAEDLNKLFESDLWHNLHMARVKPYYIAGLVLLLVALVALLA